jgi:arsenite methyltransferase
MKCINLTRLTMGSMILVGLLVFRPLAYLCGIMMVFAGLTGICFLEKLFSRMVGAPASCSLGMSTNTSASTPSRLQSMSADEIKQAVAEKYSEVAQRPGAKFNFPVGRKFAESVGYPAEVLDNLPATVCDSFTGAGNPQPYANPQRGETVLDLGCGAGLDLFFHARAVGKEGKLYGLDMSRAMIDKARKSLASCGIQNVEFLNVSADAIPLPDASVDLVTANGIYNLSPDKEAVMREVYRVLKVGGRTVFAEIVLKSPLPVEIRKNIDDWFRCIGGALPKAEFLTRLTAVGFREPHLLWEGRNARTGHELAVCAVIRAER